MKWQFWTENCAELSEVLHQNLQLFLLHLARIFIISQQISSTVQLYVTTIDASI